MLRTDPCATSSHLVGAGADGQPMNARAVQESRLPTSHRVAAFVPASLPASRVPGGLPSPVTVRYQVALIGQARTIALPGDPTSPQALPLVRLVLNVIATFMLLLFAGLAVAATAPRLFGYGSVVVTSGSMEPAVHKSDVVVTAPSDGVDLGEGAVIDFDRDGERILHRVALVTPNGYRTAGDANATTDPELVSPSQVRGVGIVVVPFIGLPATWAAEGRWLHLAHGARCADRLSLHEPGPLARTSPRRAVAMNATDPHERGKPTQVNAQADAALRTVRIVLAVLAILVLAAYRPLTGPPSWVSLATVLAATIAAVAALNAISRRLPDRRTWAALTQALDVIAMVALAVALDDPLDHQSWVLLVIPVVSAAVRSGALASLLSWIGGSAGYLAAAHLGVIGSDPDVALLTRIPGTLLAVAITIGLLARWMREGWEIQNEITAIVAAREQRLSVLEQARHALTNTGPDDALTVCASRALALGFEAVTVHPVGQAEPAHVIGRSDLVAAIDPSCHDASQGAVVTIWTDGTEVRSHSVSVHEPRTDSLITGWSEAPLANDDAQALVTLVAIASTAIESTTLLRQLRHAADHDALTGLLNRGALDRKLADLARQPGRISIAFIDLDDFKRINDTHGHDIGDKALIILARRLEAVAGTRGLISRYGGDEFVALLPDIHLEDAKGFAEAALRHASGTVAIGPANVNLDLSIGIAAGQTPLDPAKLLHTADNALYQAKSAGKATFAAIAVNAPQALKATNHGNRQPTRLP